MNRLYSYLIFSYLGPFFITFFIALFVLVMQFLWKYVDDLVGKGLELHIIAELLFYASANLVPLSLPLAILLSSLMLFGNLGEDFELVAMKSSGISLQNIMMPLLFISILISGIAFYFSNNIWPMANLKMGSLLWDVRQQKPAFNLKEGIFYQGIEGYSIRAGRKIDENTLEDILIYDHTSHSGNNKVIAAKKGIMKITDKGLTLSLTLHDGYCYDEQDNPKTKQPGLPHRKIKFNNETLRFDLSSFKMERSSEELFRDHYQMLNVQQLMMVSDSLMIKLEERRSEIPGIMQRRYQFYSEDTIQVQPSVMAGAPALQAPGVLHARIQPTMPATPDMRVYDIALMTARGHASYISAMKSEIRSRLDLLIRYKIEWHRKFTLSIACLILFFVGAPLGAIIRKGGFGMPVVVSGLLFTLFHIISITGEKFTREGIVEPWQGMWFPSLFFLPFGIFLTYKATMDSVMMDIDTYLQFFKKLIPVKQEP